MAEIGEFNYDDPTMGIDPAERSAMDESRHDERVYGGGPTAPSGPEEPDVWDEYSKRILEELQGIASGRVKTEAEKQALDLSKQIGTAGFSVAKSRRGVTPGSTFGAAAEQAGLIRSAGEQRASEINRAARLAASQEALRFQASKAAEQRGLSLGYQSLLQQQQQAEAQATQSLFGSFLQFGSNILMALLI